MKTNIILLISFVLSVSKLLSQPGILDLSFGDSGKVLYTTQTGFPSPANAVIIKEDGKILVGSGEYVSEKKVFLQKQCLTDGTPDLSFGKNGEVRTDFGNGVGGFITAMAVTSDHKIITAGIGGLDAFTPHGADVLLAKYDDKGNLEADFGANGLVIVDFGLFEYAQCVKLLNDNKILVGGCARKTPNFEGKNNFLLVRFNADGSLDSSFGDNGKVITDVGLIYGSVINSIAVTADGSVIAAGKAENLSGSIYNKILLAKYTADGELITDFGVDGFVFTDPSDGQDFATSVALQDDGKIVAAGVTGAYSTQQAGMCIMRYNENGSPDSSFNQTGVFVIYFGDDNAWAEALMIQKDKSFLLGGFKYQNSLTPDVSAYDFALASVTTDGSLNASFGKGGTVTTDFSNLIDYCNAIALQPDGKIVAAGGSSDSLGTISYITLARYNNDTKSKKQILITKIRRWLQHHNGIVWDNMPGVKSYAVQRSADGVKWTTVHSQQSTANSQSSIVNSTLSTINYYNDASPLPGTNYYRLQVTSVNGAIAYSNVIAINNEPSTISLSPNPAKNVLHIQGLTSSNKAKITVVDFAGNEKLQAVSNNILYNLNIASLKAGNYLLRVETGDKVIMKQFVKE